jgi:hypothetical protein
MWSEWNPGRSRSPPAEPFGWPVPKAGLKKLFFGARVPEPRKLLSTGCAIVNAVLSAQGQNLVYECGQCQIDLGRRELRSNGVAAPLGARAFEIVEILLQSANELVTKNNIMSGVWPGAIIGENTLQVHISAIRKALGADRALLKRAERRLLSKQRRLYQPKTATAHWI